MQCVPSGGTLPACLKPALTRLFRYNRSKYVKMAGTSIKGLTKGVKGKVSNSLQQHGCHSDKMASSNS